MAVSKKDEVLIKWKTNDKWHNEEQPVKRKSIKPVDGPLEIGMRVKILFDRQWSDGEVCEKWPKERKSQGVKEKKVAKKQNDSGSDDEMPLSSLKKARKLEPEPTSSTKPSEAAYLAKYVQTRDAHLKGDTKNSEKSVRIPVGTEQLKTAAALKTNTDGAPKLIDDDKLKLQKLLDAEKKRSEALTREKNTAEANFQAMQKKLEADKRSLMEALEAEKSKQMKDTRQRNEQASLDFMENIYGSLAGIQGQLNRIDERLSLIEANTTFNLTAVQPDPAFSTPDVSLSSFSAVCSDIQLQAPTQTTLPLQSLDSSPDIQQIMPVELTPHSSKRTATSTSVSPLVSHLSPGKANRVKKIRRHDSKQYTRNCMDVVFSKDEMATSNVGGKREKEKLDEGRLDLVKRLTYTVFPPTNIASDEREFKDAINARCREVRHQNKSGKDKDSEPSGGSSGQQQK